MKQLDEIIYDAIKADDAIMTIIGGRVVSTCFEVSPLDVDSTPIPYIIVHNSGFTNQQSTKDELWEALEDQEITTVEVAAESPKAVRSIVAKTRRAIGNYIHWMCEQEHSDIPMLQSLTSNGIDWDWEKPCYYQQLDFNCIIFKGQEDEEAE